MEDQHDRTGKQSEKAAVIDVRLLEIVVCPLSKTVLDYDVAAQELISRAARLAFPIRDGIPILLAEEARRIEP